MSSAGQSVSAVRRRAALLTTWRLTPDPAVRTAIECSLFGVPDPDRAREEAERFAVFSGREPG